jgi:transcriptional regulator with XRE-family HTH domain
VKPAAAFFAGKVLATMEGFEPEWTGDELAEASGLQSSTISRLLRNTRAPNIDTVMRICLALEVEPHTMLPSLAELRAQSDSGKRG